MATDVGASLDFSVSALKGKLDLYGEIGRDTQDRDLLTLGAYFPGLYQRYDLDVFLEWSDVTDFRFARNSELLLRAYRPLSDDLHAFLAAGKRADGDEVYGIGLVCKLPEPRNPRYSGAE